MRHITEVFQNALGSAVSDFARGGALGPQDIESIRSHYLEWTSTPDTFSRGRNELWPLISHHDDPAGTVVLRNLVAGTGQSDKDHQEELRMHLVGCNGVVIADPLRRVFFDVAGRPVQSPTSENLHRIASGLAGIETFIVKDIVQVSKVHPVLDSEARQTWIEPFNLGDNLRVLTDFVEAGYSQFLTQHGQDLYANKVEELLTSCGIRQADLGTDLTPLEKVQSFARALLEVSWQLANATQTDADLYLTNRLERRVFEILVEDCVDLMASHRHLVDGVETTGAHLQMLATVGLPLLDPAKVSPADIAEIRAGDAFSEWRNTLSGALDTYATERLVHHSDKKRGIGSRLRCARRKPASPPQ